ncbi:FAD/NAD(P)-binding protein [Burkholderia sp. Ac-20345]|uniref:FAD/NAD(P)-binding protein n=1 Tax=Burkholderia sp. Ac-20345 TaxID=2703891 RepID=UPI00197C93AC|nr:FAD/NAD(P)-binding protein [Burkholderia sp. Ac-20345]MBN3781191.1 FAD/NAD(P)-binding protein [Burkholderia sp. Ac-20345]
MDRINVAIVGMGQRGLTLLERLHAVLSERDLDVGIDLHLIDPSTPGQGIHEWSQPEHLLVNTIAAQITMYCDDSVTDSGPVLPGPSFLEWALERGYKKLGGRYLVSDEGESINENTYLSRAVLGEYLTWVYDRLIDTLPDYVNVINHRRNVVDIVPIDSHRIEVRLDGGFRIDANYVFLTMGHSLGGTDAFDRKFENWAAHGKAGNSHLAYFKSPYPINSINSISSQARVAICGTGLTATDAISALTIGLGGRFEKVSVDRYRYIPCGREPKITVFSRQGLPAGGRAVNQKGTYGQYKAKFFTRDFVDACRAKNRLERGNEQLDFDRDLWPTLKKEMAYVYSSSASGVWTDPATYQVEPEVDAAIDLLMVPAAHLEFVDQEAYRTYVRGHLIEDIADCFGGNVDNPRKAAADILRDIRDNIRHAVDYCRLTPESHRRFLSYWCSISNRIASGPPKERNMEMLALIDAGVLSFFGPRPELGYDDQHHCFTLSTDRFGKPVQEAFDVLIRAKVDLFEPEASPSPLVRNMLASGVVTPFSNGDFKPSGIEITQGVNVINRAGDVIPNLWALGYVVEGAHFYTYVLPRPFSNSRGLQDAGRACIAMVDDIAARCETEQELDAEAV